MSGTTVIRHLLANNAELAAIVPVERIQAGDLPLSTELPAISVKKVSRRKHNNLAVSAGVRLYTERVQVTAMAVDVVSGTPQSGYDLVETIMRLVVAACPLSRGTVNGVECHGVISDTEGPDLYDHETLTYSQSQDFIVHFRR